MTTKAELEAELKTLKARLAAPPDQDGTATGDQSTPHENAPPDWLEAVAKDHGIDTEEVKTALEQLGADLQSLPRNQPVLAMALAFAVGFLAGRATKN